MNLARFATQNLKPIAFVTLVLCLIGAISIFGFPVAILPDVSFPRAVIIAEAGDAPASLVETQITKPLEAAASSVAGVSRLRSTTQRGATEISVDFGWDIDMDRALATLNTKIGEARADLPAGANISIERMNPTVFPVLGLSLQSKTLSQTQLWQIANFQLRPQLARVDGVARCVVQGGDVPEIAVEVAPQKLQAYGIALSDVEGALRDSNIVRAAGRFNQSFQQYQLLVSGQEQTAADLRNVVVANRNGTPILLRYVADVHPSVADRTTMVTAQGGPAVLLNIVRQPTANTISTAAAVEAEAARLQKTLPRGVQLQTFYDQSILVGEAVSSVRDAVLIGGVLSVVVLMLFLGDWRATGVTALIIPATVLITFLLMRLSGLSLNLMTLGALAVGVGLVIDDAIVVVENVFRHLAEGHSPSHATQIAAREIGAPMISSTLTVVVVFLPLVLLTGVVGAFFTALAVTLVIALMVSLVLALLVSPSLCAVFLRVRTGQKEHGRLFERVLDGYEAILRIFLRRQWVWPVAVVLLGITTYHFWTSLGTGFMPEMDEGAFVLDYNTPPGTSLQESDRLLRKIEVILDNTPEIASWSRRTGTELGFAITEPNRGDFAVMLKSNRSRPIDEVMDNVRTQVQQEIPGIDIEFIQVIGDIIGDLSGSAAPVEIKLWGQNPDQLSAAADQVAAKLEKVPGVVDVANGVVEAGPEVVAHIDPVKAGRLGFSPNSVADQVSAALYGTDATQILQGDQAISVRVRLPEQYRRDEAQMSTIPLRSPNGFTVPLGQVASFENVAGTRESNREDLRRLVNVQAGLDGSTDLGTVIDAAQKFMAAQKLPAGVTWSLGGQYKSQQESNANLRQVGALAILLVFSVMLFQFGSFTAPVSILMVMPLSLFGVALALSATGTPLNVSSEMGAVMLVGIVVKNGILLLDQAQKAEEDGIPLEDAVLGAGRVRLRPILMTTLTAILGLVPLALGIGAGAEMQKPLAIAVIGGLSFSTLFTLILAPLIYVSLRRFQTRFRRAPAA